MNVSKWSSKGTLITVEKVKGEFIVTLSTEHHSASATWKELYAAMAEAAQR